MGVVQESKNAQYSPERKCTQWPPKSPFQALLSSPSGRRKWEEHYNRAEQRTPSPSPARHAPQPRHLSQHVTKLSEDEDEDEDEEVLKLKLKQIEAKLKLKQLRKHKQSENRSAQTDGEVGSDITLQTACGLGNRQHIPQNAVEVPVSPTRDRNLSQQQLSPARVRLGLTAAPRAEDISLKRARDGTRLSRSNSLHHKLLASLNEEEIRPKSFNERLAESKDVSDQRQARSERLSRIRKSGFNCLATGMSSGGNKDAKVETNSKGKGTQLKAPVSLSLPQYSTSSENPLTTYPASMRKPDRLSQHSSHENQSLRKGSLSSKGNHTESEDNISTPGYDPFSEIHLSKRHILHSIVAREMAGKEIYTLPRLLKEIKSPSYEAPDCESDFVVFAILASKSAPFDQAQTHRTNEKHAKDALDAPRNKFMVLHLCDLKWEIDCFLFGTAFTQFWKLTPGTLLAILNPAILPPKGNQYNGRFSLKLGSSEDCVMEIGVARDLGYCSSVKKDGEQCGQWVNKSKTEACDFHISLIVDKSRKHRMEVNTMWRGTSSPENRHNSRVARTGGKPARKLGGIYHAEFGQVYTVNSGMGKSTASLLDSEDTDALHNIIQGETSRKRVAAAQKERDLAKQLAGLGNSVGAEYLRASNSSMQTISSSSRDAAADARDTLFAKPSASELGLLGNKASEAHLSPAKDRKPHFGLGALSSTTGGPTAMGWGGAGKSNLLQPKQGRIGSLEKGQTRLEMEGKQAKSTMPETQYSSIRSAGSMSPQKKRARFALAKGIREPGRESLPGEEHLASAIEDPGHRHEYDDDDEDELDIV